MICGFCQRETPTPACAVNTMYRCWYYGSPHSLPSGEPIGPRLQPIDATGVLSPWFAARYHPYITGVFECEFDAGLRLRLCWSGGAWMWCGEHVDMTNLLKWRGVW